MRSESGQAGSVLTAATTTTTTTTTTTAMMMMQAALVPGLCRLCGDRGIVGSATRSTPPLSSILKSESAGSSRYAASASSPTFSHSLALDEALRKAPLQHRRLVFMNKILNHYPVGQAGRANSFSENSTSSWSSNTQEEANATSEDWAIATFEELASTGNVCKACRTFIDQQLDYEIQTALEDKQKYLHAQRDFTAKRNQHAAATAASGSAAEGAGKHEASETRTAEPEAETSLTSVEPGLFSGTEGADTSHMHPQQHLRDDADGVRPMDSVKDADRADWHPAADTCKAVSKRQIAFSMKQTVLTDRLLRLHNDVEESSNEARARIARTLENIQDMTARTNIIQAAEPEVNRLSTHSFQSMGPVEPAASTRVNRASQQAFQGEYACASINNVAFGFVPPPQSQKHQRWGRHHASRAGFMANSSSVRDINVAWGMVASVVAGVQRVLLARGSRMNCRPPRNAVLAKARKSDCNYRFTETFGGCEAHCGSISKTLERITAVHVVEAGARSKIVVRQKASARASSTSSSGSGSSSGNAAEHGGRGGRAWRGRGRGRGGTPTHTQPATRSYDLFLVLGQSRISFTFGVMVFVELLKNIGQHCVDLLQTASFDKGTQKGEQYAQWTRRLTSFKIRGDALGGHALSFLDFDFENAEVERDSDAPGGRNSTSGYGEARAAMARWNAAMDQLLQHVKSVLQVISAMQLLPAKNESRRWSLKQSTRSVPGKRRAISPTQQPQQQLQSGDHPGPSHRQPRIVD